MVGWDNYAAATEYGNGSDLAALITAFDAAVQAVIVPRLDAGEDPFQIIPDLNAWPTGGFGPVPGEVAGSPCANEYEMVFDSGTGAPPLLMQTVASWESDFDAGIYEPIAPMEQLFPTAIAVENGVYTLYFYSGFYS